jgi:hypothetical protein
VTTHSSTTSAVSTGSAPSSSSSKTENKADEKKKSSLLKKATKVFFGGGASGATTSSTSSSTSSNQASKEKTTQWIKKMNASYEAEGSTTRLVYDPTNSSGYAITTVKKPAPTLGDEIVAGVIKAGEKEYATLKTEADQKSRDKPVLASTQTAATPSTSPVVIKPTQHVQTNDLNSKFKEFSAANVYNPPGPGYPDPYYSGAAVKAVKYTDAGGKKATITELENGVRIEQVAGGTPYRVYTPPTANTLGAQDGTHPIPGVNAPANYGQPKPSDTTPPTPPPSMTMGAQDGTHPIPGVNAPINYEPPKPNDVTPSVTPPLTTPTSSSLPNVVSSGAHNVGGGTTPVYTATPSPSPPPTPYTSYVSNPDPTHGGPIAATPAPTVTTGATDPNPVKVPPPPDLNPFAAYVQGSGASTHGPS